MRKTLLAIVAAVGLMIAKPTANAQLAVIDPANLHIAWKMWLDRM